MHAPGKNLRKVTLIFHCAFAKKHNINKLLSKLLIKFYQPILEKDCNNYFIVTRIKF